MDENDNDKDPFNNVPFVNNITHHSLKIRVKNLWSNLQLFGNHIETNRKDICYQLDAILDGNKPNINAITNTKRFTIHDGKVIEYDSLTDSFKIFDRKAMKLSAEIKALDYETIKNELFKQ